MRKISPYKKILPTIYAYTTPEIPKHDGWTKIGYTTQPVEERIRQQTQTADVDFKIEWAEVAKFSVAPKNFFLDYDFHKFLLKNNIERKIKTEWFKILPDDAQKYFHKFRDRDFFQGGETYELREEQSQAVEKTFQHWQNKISEKFLWNAKPRFGKTLATYDFIRKIRAEKILIVTNRPSIANSWFDDFQKFIAWQTDYKFVSETDALKDEPILSRDEFINFSLENENAKMIAFYSLQDLKGAKCFGGDIEKHSWIKNLDWDLIVIDEAHEGVDTDKAETLFDNLKTNFTLHLSGTPFKALADKKFSNEEIFNWSYADEQNAKLNWSADSANPYENLPRMNLFTYQLSKIIADKIKNFSEDEDSEIAFDLNEFFKTQNGKFIHEVEVKKFLDALTTQEKFPFSTPELRAELAHTFWLMYRVDDAKAMAKLLKRHKIFSEYEIIVVAGDGRVEWQDNEQNKKSFNKVKDAIKKFPKTITLSVGQLTTGVTIREWTGVLMLSSMRSATEYFQAAFRAQNPFTDSEKFLRKENCYVFDFAPERTLLMFDEFANNLNSTSADRTENIKTLLNFFPVLAEDDEGKMIELDAEKVLSLPNKIKVREVVERGFISNFLFANIGNIFSASEAVIEILKKIPPEETQADRKNIFKIDVAKEIHFDDDGKIFVPEEIVISRTDELFGKKIVAEVTKNINEQSGEKPLSKIVVDTFTEKISDVVKTEYNLSKKQFEKLIKPIEAEAEKIFENAEEKSAEEFFQKVTDFFEEKPKEIVKVLETHNEEGKKNSSENDARAHLRGFARTIPSFIMAYIDKIQADGETLTLKNFEQYPDEKTFLEVTSITKAEFKILRDEKNFFDEIIFNDAVAEFIKLKEKLGDYFSIGRDDDIFNYIPPQKTNQIFTPREVVKKMADLLEKNNPGIFDDAEQKFFDCYMKSGLFAVEVIKRLYRSEKISAEIPDNHARLKHILENQIYGCAPTEIIFNIATAYIFGAKTEMTGISRKNFLRADVSASVERGDFADFVKKNFLQVKVLTVDNLIKSRERVKKFGEVFTPPEIVNKMLDELPKDFFSDLNQKFLEPAAGEGVFLMEILKRKLNFADSPEKMFQAVKSLFAIEIQSDNLQKLRENLEKIFINHYEKFFGTPDENIFAELKIILQNNLVEGDALEFFAEHQSLIKEKFVTLAAEDFSNAVIISNPPYQKDIPKDSDNKTFAAPIYHKFLAQSWEVAKISVMIHPARCLFNAGATPKDFNKKLLTNPHVKVVFYEPDCRKVFPDNDIKGGIAITYFDKKENFGAIDTFTPFKELNSILHKVCIENKNFSPLSKIMYAAEIYHFTDKMHEDFPNAKNKLSRGHAYDLKTSVLEKLPEIFLDSKPDDEHEYIKILGLQKAKRIFKFIREDYINNPESLKKFKILVPAANGSGAIGEVLSTPLVGLPLVGLPLVGCTQTFITVGAFKSEAEARACLAYIKSKFCRAMLGILKVTQHNPPQTWAKVPLQDFSSNLDIDWSKKISEIDEQLYKKYSLSAEEIKFIEEKVRAME